MRSNSQKKLGGGRMAKKVKNIVKLQIPAGQASAAPPVGPVLGQNGISIPQFIKEFNDKTSKQVPGMLTPVVITVYTDASYTFITKTPPVPTLLKKALNLQKGSGNPKTEKVSTITRAQLREIAETKMVDTNAASIEAAMNLVAGTARSMGIKVEEEE